MADEGSASPHASSRSAVQACLVLVGVATLLCSVLAALQTVYLALRLRTPLLLADEWRVLPRFIEFMNGKLSLLSFLWEDHFGHRPVLSRLLFILDIAVDNGTQALPKTISICLCLLLTMLFAALLLQQKAIPWSFRLIGAGLIILTMLSGQQIENFLIGWNGAIPITVWFSVLALYCLVKSIEQTTGGGHQDLLLFVCAILSGIVATCSMANGLLIWPIMLLPCLVYRAWSWAGIVTVVGVAVAAIYFWDFHGTGMLLDALKQPGALLAYFTVFLGNPAIALGAEASAAFGILGLGLVCYHFFRQSWRADDDSLNGWFLLCVCLFVIGTAGLVSVGRLKFGAEVGIQSDESAIGPLALRYYSFIAPCWVAVLLLGFIRLKQNLKRARGGAWIVFDSGALVLSMGMCAGAYAMGPGTDWLMLNRHERYEQAATAIVAGTPDRTVLKNIYSFSDVDKLLLAPYLASHRLSVFHSDVDLLLYDKMRDMLHKSLPAETSLEGKWCAGSIDEIDKIAGAGPIGVEWNLVKGWGWDRERDRAADGVMFLDEDRRLVGIGRMLYTRADVGRALNWRNAELKIHYVGYVEMAASQAVVGYAFNIARHELCKFGEKNTHQ